MKILFRTAPALILALFLYACSSGENELTLRLRGEWTVESYEESRAGAASSAVNNIGTMTFSDDTRGAHDVAYTFMGTSYTDKSLFQWTATDNTVRITGQEGKFNKAWIVVVNEKNRQEWKSTDGQGNVQVLRLRRK